MSAPLTPDDIARMVADAEKYSGYDRPWLDELASHVRALAAECKRIGDLYAEEQDYRRNYGKGESTEAAKRIMEMCVREFGKCGIGVMEQRVASDIKTYALTIIAERESLRAQLEAVTRERDEARSSLAKMNEAFKETRGL